jgi:AraC family transcriptional regulator of adaptative response/methylated-DNA-[protein]-cysteine methyltransferase
MSAAEKTAMPAAMTLDDPRWAAVAARDAKADGKFFYAVTTTGVYCRPSCAARLARPEHVCFFTSSDAAEAAGFRPCRRCKPDQMPLAALHASRIADACRTIEQSESMLSLAQLAQLAELSTYHFHRLFKQITGLTPRQYAQAHRARRMQDALTQSGSVTAAIFQAGFNASSRFYEKSDALLGMTPTVYRAGGVGTAIRFAVGQCSLGAVLVAQSVRGICAILLGDDPDELLRDLQDRFPRAEFIGGDAGFEEVVATVVGFVDAPGIGLDLPLDIRGTAFQQRVWEALRAIPAGATVTYTEIARRIGAPEAVRAVAGACAANPLAVAIPCHRVVRLDGNLSGYRWGIERKRALLDMEAKR